MPANPVVKTLGILKDSLPGFLPALKDVMLNANRNTH